MAERATSPIYLPTVTQFASIALFAATFTSIMALVHYFLWARLVRDTALPAVATRVLTTVLIALCVSLPASLLLAPGPIIATLPGGGCASALRRRSEAGKTIAILFTLA